MSKQYATIYCDPPWKESGGGKIKRGADRHYPLMATKDIIAMAPFIEKISLPDSHLYMWVTNNFLQDGFKVMAAWGYRYVTKITWVKGNPGPPIVLEKAGLGQYYRGLSEDCLFGVKGKVPYKVKDGKRQQGVTAFIAPRGQHSEKPEFMRQQIEKVSYPPFVELFARPKEEPTEQEIFETAVKVQWDYMGDEADGTTF